MSAGQRPFSDKLAGEVVEIQIATIKRLEARAAGATALLEALRPFKALIDRLESDPDYPALRPDGGPMEMNVDIADLAAARAAILAHEQMEARSAAASGKTQEIDRDFGKDATPPRGRFQDRSAE